MKQAKTRPDLVGEENTRGFAIWKIANPWSRLLAQFIDQSLVGIATAISLSYWFSDRIGTVHWFAAFFALSIYVSLLTQIFFLKLYGNTPGKSLTKLEIRSARPNQGITFLQIILRQFSWWIGLFSFGMTWISILGLSDRRAWHDIVSETVVVHQTKKAAFTKPYEKTFYIAWQALILILFMTLLIGSMLFQFKALKSGSLTIGDSQEDLKKYSDEWHSWFLLAGLNDSGLNDSGLNHASESQPKSEFQAQGAALQVMKKIESKNDVNSQIAILETEVGHHKINSLEASALRTAQARLLLKSGEFTEAKDVLSSAQNSLRNPTQAEKEIFSLFSVRLKELTCQAKALSDCEFSSSDSCLDNPYWKAWTAGCQMTKDPNHFDFSASALGYWWKKANTPGIKFENLVAWEKVKIQFSARSSNFEESVFSALDLVLNLKTSNPGDLVGKSKNMGSENILWGWAQSNALAEFGKQWTFLIHPSEKKLIARYNLLEKVSHPMVASRKKVGQQTEASTLPAGPRAAPVQRPQGNPE